MSIAGDIIGFVGAGAMAEALAKGLTRAKVVDANQIIGSDVSSHRRQAWSELGMTCLEDNRRVVAQASTVVLAVKPQVIKTVLDELADEFTEDHLVISIAAGIATSFIESRVKTKVPVVRAMPNTACLVGASATALCKGRFATSAHLAKARAVFEAAGTVVEVEERLMDAVTGLSGSGPAYVFVLLEALSDAGVKCGLPRQTATLLATQTVLGAAKLATETGKHPGLLKEAVTSPGGTTIAGLHELENGRFRATLMNAVTAATRRSEELGKSSQQ